MEKKTALIILDGWGIGKDKKVDAIYQAQTPFVDSLVENYPHSTLVTYGNQVGLPEGQMGNSEVGHMNIGAGRVVFQELVRINNAINDGSFYKNKVLNDAFTKAKEKGQTVHFFGLVSDGGVHSHTGHLKAMCNMVEEYQIEKSFIHAITDGRDCDPKSGVVFMDELGTFLEDKNTKFASIVGRYYAMDRDNRWERVKLAYDLWVHGQGEFSSNWKETVKEKYIEKETDEFLKPILLDKAGIMKSGDLVICFNFRTDRPREITQVLTQSAIAEFDLFPLDLDFVTMTRYKADFKNIGVVYEKDQLKNTIGEVIANHGKTQLRIAETEKYPHVTFFFNGGKEELFTGEHRIVVPSPKVSTYDILPKMSAYEVTIKTIKNIHDSNPDFICLNYANTDMVGHTGIFSAAMEAAHSVDECLSILVPVMKNNGYSIIVIADHGNSDYMVNPDGSPHTAHTLNPVHCILVDDRKPNLKNGKLADIAPTLLSLMEIEIPKEMDGINLMG